MGPIRLDLEKAQQWTPSAVPAVDYDAIAQKYGGQAAAPSPETDYDAIAKKYGGTAAATDDERRTMLGFLGNVAGSTGRLITGLANVPKNIEGMSQLFAGMAEK